MRKRSLILGRILLILVSLASAMLASGPAEAAVPDFYWELPARLSRGVGAYPQAIMTSGRVVAIWQENEASGENGSASLSLASYGPGGVQRRDRFAGPFSYSGDAPVLFSAAADGNGTMVVAVTSGEHAVSLYRSVDGGLTFAAPRVIESTVPGVAPRIFTKTGGGWYLFVTRGVNEALSIYYSRSEDGIQWTPFEAFVGEDPLLRLNFLPSAASLDGVDIVVFQTLAGGARPSFQLYSKISTDGGATWSPPKRLTSFLDPVHRDRRSADDFDNQRPHLARIGNELWLSWERRLLSGPAQIYAVKVDKAGLSVPDSVMRVSLGQGNCSEPRVLEAAGEPAVAWFDDRRGNSRVYIAFRAGTLWSETDLSGRSRGDGAFGRAVYADNGLYAFWQAGRGAASSVLGMIPDTSVRRPSVTAVDFRPDEPIRRNRAAVSWTVPEDSSGIAGYSYLWSRDPDAVPPQSIMALETQTRASFDADADGDWYFTLRAQDYAGNWSAASKLRFVRDTTPPGSPTLLAPAASKDGFLASNSFPVEWSPPQEPDVAGYTWLLEYLGPLDRQPARKRAAASPSPEAGQDSAMAVPVDYTILPATEYETALWDGQPEKAPAPSIRTTSLRTDFSNIDDGYWSFSVAAIDRVGNIGTSARMILRADKFIPYTTVADVTSRRDDFGSLGLTIIGRGFVDDGAITLVAIDGDGVEPWDRLYELPARGYTILSDRLLTVPEVVDLSAGSYRIGLFHPVRGWYITGPRLSVDYSGTIKFGDMGAPWKPTWSFEPEVPSLISIMNLFLVAALLIPALGTILTLRQVVVVAREIRTARLEVIAVVEGTPMPALEKERAAKKAIGVLSGLTAKFALTISLLVIFIVLLVSIPLGLRMLGTQSEILARGLEQRARVLLESAVQGGKSYLPAKNILELSLIPNQASAIEEARYLTLTGFGASAATNPDIVWASNDPDITTRIDGQALVPGVSLLKDGLSARIPTIASELDAKAQAEVGAIAEAIQQLQDEGRVLAARLDAESQARLSQIAGSARDLEKTLNERLAAIANSSVSSEPSFDPGSLGGILGGKATEFIFYKPIMFRQGRESVYYRGMIRLAVSTDSIIRQVGMARTTLIQSVGIVAAIAFAIGIAGSFALSSLIIKPLLQIIDGIKHIRDEPDKQNLADYRIDIKSRDELAILASTINEMTSGLVHAAAEGKLLTVGKGVQKMFIPLIKNDSGKKLTTGFEDEPTHTFYGYYEGAKGVSGDYFDYRKLDDQYYCFIKCDVSGKGVPAALIMVGVATIFTTYFQGWSYKTDGIHLNKLTAKINDFLEKRGFVGLFAALIMGVFDSRTGDAYLCHAGDNIVRVYKPGEQQVVVHKLPSAPAAGAISGDMFDLTEVYKQVKIPLDHGDILLLYTDGFEESSRARRGSDFKQLHEMKLVKDREGKETLHDEALVEQFGEDRIKEATEAIMSRRTFAFVKEDDPLGKDFKYSFDFSKLEATPEDLVIGLAAVEKVFRLVPNPNVTANEQVIVDAKIDAVLAKCWDGYGRFCQDRRMSEDKNTTEYLHYGKINEDDQYDDLTMMIIRRK